METDVLGAPYESQVIDLRDDDEGSVTATLVRRRADVQTGAAVLYLHGFVDYFFQTHLADFFVARGIDFYALDLRKHGRSLAPHHSPNLCTDLTDYYEEIDAAVRIIRETDGHEKLLINGHSTGATTAALWAHDHRGAGLVDALLLNSAFFDLNVPWFLKNVATPIGVRVGRSRPKSTLPGALSPVYGQSLHSTARGAWTYDLAWKPLAGFPIYAGWMRAVRTAHKRVQAGLDIPVPILSAASTASYKGLKWGEGARSADAVLDVDHIVRWSAGLGRLVTIARIEGGMHDLTLSAEPAREQLFSEVSRWLTAYFPTGK